jgi:acyl carrier protein
MNDGRTVIDDVRRIVGTSLQLGPRTSSLTAASPLLGAIPEFDSMAVVGVITALEEHFGIAVADDDISGETFSTLGTLARFVEEKLAD